MRLGLLPTGMQILDAACVTQVRPPRPTWNPKNATSVLTRPGVLGRTGRANQRSQSLLATAVGAEPPDHRHPCKT